MEDLPEEILHLIFKYLDNESMCSAMKVSKRYRDIFTNYSDLMEKFILTIDDFPVFNIDSLLDVPARNLVVKNCKTAGDNDFYYESSLEHVPEIDDQHLIKILSKYENSIESLKFEKVLFKNSNHFYESIKYLPKLKHLTMDSCEIRGDFMRSPLNLKNIHSITFINNHIYFEYFYAFNGLREISFDESSIHELEIFLIKVPTIKKLSICGDHSEFFKCESFDFRLESFETILISVPFSTTLPSLSFLRSQLGSLKELKLHRLPNNYDGGEVLKFIINEMKLERFNYGSQALILNGNKQNIEEIWFNDFQISSGMEMMRQFPSIKKLRLLLCSKLFDGDRDKDCLQDDNDIFTNLRELFIHDTSHNNLIIHLTELYKNCHNLKILKIESSSNRLSSILRECLPFMTQLEEIHLGIVKKRIFRVISNNVVDLKKIFVPLEKVDEARDVFGANIFVGVYQANN